MSNNNRNNKKVIYYESKYRRKATKANWFKSINNLINNGKSQAAESELAKFLHYYPYDVPALYEYAKSLSRKAEYNEAIEVLKNILSIQKEEPYLQATYSFLFKIYYKLNMFKEAYSIIDRVNLTEYDININTFKSILEIKLNMPLSKEYKIEKLYTIDQEMSYSKEEALAHIKRHYNKNPYMEDNIIINKEVNIEELIDSIEEVLPYSKKSEAFSSCDTYFFYYPSFGCNQETKIPNCNIIKVVVLKGTYKIVNFYPAKKNDYSNYINNNLYEQKTNNKILRKTQTEKFYDRYKI